MQKSVIAYCPKCKRAQEHIQVESGEFKCAPCLHQTILLDIIKPNWREEVDK